MNRDQPFRDAGRHKPPQNVVITSHQPTILFVTVGTERRVPWLLRPSIHKHLVQAWQSAGAWIIGYYMLMPDHVHFFCAPYDQRFTVEQWVTFWKRQFRRIHKDPTCEWQAHSFHHRLRNQDNYAERWRYVQENPVRAGLATEPENWPHQGMLNTLRW